MGRDFRDRRPGGNRSGGGRDFGGRRDRGFGGGRDRQMHRTVCDACGDECEVPFRPTGDKPVYCSDCFEKNGGRDSRDSGRRDRGSGGRPSDNSELKDELRSISNKLDQVLQILKTAPEDETKKESAKKEDKEVVEEKKTTKKSAKKAVAKTAKKTANPDVKSGSRPSVGKRPAKKAVAKTAKKTTKKVAKPAKSRKA